MIIDPTEVNQRLIENELYVHGILAQPIRQLLSITPEQLDIWNLPTQHGIWTVNGTQIIGELTGFNGVIDLETTGLGYDDSVLCAVGVGWIGSEFVVCSIGNCSKLPIQHSIIWNINQPFDRSFYDIQNGKDTNLHLDLSSLAKMIHATPKFSKYGFHSYPSMSGLSEFYFQETVDKTDRDLLIGGRLSFEDTVAYCVRDVITTVRLAQKIIPDFTAKNPSPLSMYGLALRSFSVPMSPKFNGFCERLDSWYQAQLLLLQSELEKAAINALTDPDLEPLYISYPESYSNHKNLLRAIDGIESELATHLRNNPDNPRTRNRCIVKICKGEASFSSSWVALIVKSRYQGHLLRYSREHKIWMYGNQQLKNTENPEASLLTPFSKGYFSDEQLTSDVSDVRSILKSIQLWVSFSERFKEIKVDQYGYHHPRYTPAHTVTGRSVDKVFLLCPKPKQHRAGSEFLKFIEAKEGYQIVTADFDSAELIYGAHIANYFQGNSDQLGCEFARFILEGDSKAKTDIHSVVAEFVGIERDPTKNLNYGANYGQGVKARIDVLFKVTGRPYQECVELEKEYRKFYIEGKAEPFFEGMKEIARYNLPTALLMSELPNGLLNTHPSDYYTTKNNRVIQALGSDHMNLLITDVDRQMTELNLDATLILTRHDEVLYEVAEDDIPEFSKVLQSSHKFSVMCLLARLGIYEAVDKWLYFSSVDVMPRYCYNSPVTCTEVI